MTWLRRTANSPIVVALVIFVLALGPRVLDLGVFVGPDEFSWVTRSSNFSQALATGELENTYQTGHPGVTLLWVETLGAWVRYGLGWLSGSADWNSAISADQTMAVLASRRQVVAIFNSLLLALAVLLIRQLFGSGVAWVAGFLLVFDPFLLTESRAVRTEGLLTGFSALALLSLLLYYIKRRMRYAALAGVLTGLALLSKVSASVLLPVGALIFVSGPLTDKTRASKDRWRDIGLGLLIWGGTLLLTIVVLWPALWVTPVEVARKMFDYVAYRAVEGEGGGSSSFFLGAPRDYADLGPLFYPAVLLFRTTPVILGGLGLLAILIWQAAKWPGRKKASLGLLLLYLVLYLALITRSVLKFERYVIPMLPALDLMAAAGLVLAWQWLTRRLSRLGTLGWVPALAILVSQMAWVLPTHPYYYSYWNPLSGGIQQAVHVLPVGVGYEGSDQAAAYLNSLPDAGTLKVASAIARRGDHHSYDQSGWRVVFSRLYVYLYFTTAAWQTRCRNHRLFEAQASLVLVFPIRIGLRLDLSRAGGPVFWRRYQA
jgi:hypothetical protein